MPLRRQQPRTGSVTTNDSDQLRKLGEDNVSLGMAAIVRKASSFIKLPIAISHSITMSLIQQASDLNNRAVTALAEGNDKVAIQSMTQSVKILKQELAKAERTSESSCSSSKHASQANDWKTVKIPHLTTGDDHHELFDHAIQVPCHVGENSPVETRACGAAVIFNLALAHHRQGLQGNGSFNKRQPSCTRWSFES